MNRTGILASALLVGFLLAAPAGAQVALVVGSVRDQHGAAVEGASVVATGRTGARLAATLTDVSGTFALSVQDAATVTIACRFCASRTVEVVPDQPVVAIVRRFDALLDDSPSPRDLANLPYAHIESAMALRPFSLLRQTTGVLPGSQLSDRGLAPANALLVDAATPNYDVVLGTTPYDTIPAKYEQAGTVIGPAAAFLYGDQAGSGIVSLEPFGGDDADVALTGSDQTLRLQSGSDLARIAAGTYSNDSESRQRADAQLRFPLSTAQTLLLGGGASQDHDYGNPASTLNGNFTFANAASDDAQPTSDVHASFVADRGGYVASEGGLAVTDIWSDSNFTAGARTRGPIAAFVDLSNRLSTGIYDASAYQAPRIAGTLTQDRVDAGIDVTGRDYGVTAGVGLFGVHYTGGSDGTSVPSNAQLATPSLLVRLFPSSKWSADLDASGSFTLPTLWQQYGFEGGYHGFVYDRNSLYSATLSYTDAARVVVSVEGASQHVTGYTNGVVTSDGISVAWQIAPAISLRAWTMNVGDSTVAPLANPYYTSGSPSNVNAIWLTYENGAAVRIDAIYRRDILDRQPFEHLDAAISGPITERLRWFAGVEDRQRTNYIDVGVRFGGP